jgi:hypothetical protein
MCVCACVSVCVLIYIRACMCCVYVCPSHVYINMCVRITYSQVTDAEGSVNSMGANFATSKGVIKSLPDSVVA